MNAEHTSAPALLPTHPQALGHLRQILRRRHHSLYLASLTLVALSGTVGALAALAYLRDALPMLAIVLMGGASGTGTVAGIILLDRYHRQVQQDLEDHPIVLALHSPGLMRIEAVEVLPDEHGRQPVIVTLSTGARYTLSTRPNEVRPVVALFEAQAA